MNTQIVTARIAAVAQIPTVAVACGLTPALRPLCCSDLRDMCRDRHEPWERFRLGAGSHAGGSNSLAKRGFMNSSPYVASRSTPRTNASRG